MRQNTSWSAVITIESLGSPEEMLLTQAHWSFSSLWKFSACALENIFSYLSFKWLICSVALLLKTGVCFTLFLNTRKWIYVSSCLSWAHQQTEKTCTIFNVVIGKFFLTWIWISLIYFEVVTIHSYDFYRSLQMNASKFFTVPSGHMFFCMSIFVLKIML